MKSKRGVFIVLDGGEGSGKTSLLKKVSECYGDKVVITREPGGSAIAERIRRLILSKGLKKADGTTMFFLFWAARLDHLKNVIVPALEEGKIVISDRFDSSTFAYQVVAQNERSLERLFWDIRHHYVGEHKPNVYAYLDLKPEIGLARKKKQKDEKSNHFDEKELKFHRALRRGFKEFLAMDEHGIRGRIINAKKSKNEVWRSFKKIIDSEIKRR